MFWPIHYKNALVIIGTVGKVIESLDMCNEIRNALFFSISRQTLQLFNTYAVEIFNHYKDYDRNILYIMTEEDSRINLK